MGALLAGHGSTAACFRKRIGIARMSVIRATCSATVGDLHGPTIAASFTTALRRGPMESPGASGKKLVWWDEEKKQWGGLDNPDYPKEVSPDTKDNLAKGKGVEALGGARPFTLHPDGVGWLYVASGLKDGPLPTHYQPLESPVSNAWYKQNGNPAALKRDRPDNPYANSPGDPRFPYVLSTYRLTEQHTAGGMTRTLSHLAELQPELFTEVSPELADEIGLTHGDYPTLSTPP